MVSSPPKRFVVLPGVVLLFEPKAPPPPPPEFCVVLKKLIVGRVASGLGRDPIQGIDVAVHARLLTKVG